MFKMEIDFFVRSLFYWALIVMDDDGRVLFGTAMPSVSVSIILFEFFLAQDSILLLPLQGRLPNEYV